MGSGVASYASTTRSNVPEEGAVERGLPARSTRKLFSWGRVVSVYGCSTPTRSGLR